MSYSLNITISYRTLENLELIKSVANGPITIEELAAQYVKEKASLQSLGAALLKKNLKKWSEEY